MAHIDPDVLWQRLDKVQDIGVPAGVLDLLLRHLGCRLDRAEQDVEPYRPGVQRRLLRHERELLAVLLDVEVRDALLVELHATPVPA